MKKSARSLNAAEPQQPPKKRDAAVAQQVILDTARKHFVAKGLAGARTDEIAKESGYSKAMIYHYYKNKEMLYLKVLEETYQRFITPRSTIKVATLGPVKALEAFVREAAESVRKDPDILSLLSIENLYQAAYLKHSLTVSRLYPPLMLQLEEIVREGERRKLFRPGIDVTHLYVSLSSLIFHVVSNRFTLSVTLGLDACSQEFFDQQVSYAVSMVLGFCVASRESRKANAASDHPDVSERAPGRAHRGLRAR